MSHESLALFYCPVIIGFPKHFERCRPLFLDLVSHTIWLHIAASKSLLFFSLWGYSRYLYSRRNNASIATYRRLALVLFRNLYPPPTFFWKERELLRQTLHKIQKLKEIHVVMFGKFHNRQFLVLKSPSSWSIAEKFLFATAISTQLHFSLAIVSLPLQTSVPLFIKVGLLSVSLST